MSLLTQQLTNKFPYYYRIRKDLSSFGARFLSVFADSMQDLKLVNKLTTNNLLLTTYQAPLTNLFTTTIEPLEQILVSNQYEFLYPTIIGDTIELERQETITDLMYNLSEELEITNTLFHGGLTVWSSAAPSTFIELPRQERLAVTVQSSNDYVQPNSLEDNSEPEIAQIILTGYNSNYDIVSEVIDILDDGNYLTNNTYYLLTDVISEGFDGEVTIAPHITNANIKASFLSTITIDDFDSILYYSISNDRLIFGGRVLTDGQAYRDDANLFENLIEFCQISLFDSADTIITDIIDINESLVNGYLYILTEEKIHVFDVNIPSFEPHGIDQSIEEYLLIETDIPYVTIDTMGAWWTRLAIDADKIEWVSIKIIDPDLVESYLQLDKTWGVTEAHFQPSLIEGRNQWTNFKFTETLTKYGQYNVVATVAIGKNKFTTVTSVIVPKLIAKYSTTHDITDPLGIYFNLNSELCIYTSDIIYDMNFVRNEYFIDEEDGSIYTVRDYDLIEVSYG